MAQAATPEPQGSTAVAESRAAVRPSIPRLLALAAADIKLAHSVFALPFAVLAAFLARDTSAGWSRFAGQLGLIVVCMVLARTWAMLVNRLADRALDAANPRTRRRVIASGLLGAREALLITLADGALFIGVCSLFYVFFHNAWPVILGGPVLAWVAFYSFTKRFTVLCHLFLGSALAVSPLAAAIAVNPGALWHQPALWWLAGMVLCWVAGFDIIYALQDVEFDRGAGLFSLPSRSGARTAIWLSRLLHLGALAMLVDVYRSEPRFGLVFGAAVGMVGALLIAEHVVLVRRGKEGLEMAFFTLNGVVSVVLGLLGVIDTTLF